VMVGGVVLCSAAADVADILRRRPRLKR
jgi:hypothetical protein